jgi:hypothetical protein
LISGPHTSRFSDQARWLLFVFLYAVLANVPYWIASHWLGLLPIGWFCVEYAVIGLLALFLPGVLSATLLLVVIAADLLSGICKTYYLAPSECFDNIGSLHELPGGRSLAVAAVVLITLALVTVALRYPVARIHGVCKVSAASCFLAFCAVILSLDCASMIRETGRLPGIIDHSSPDARTIRYFRSPWLARYPEVRLVRLEKSLGGHWSTTAAALNQAPLLSSAAAEAMRSTALTSGRPLRDLPNLVIVLTESWGFDEDPAVRNSLVRPYFQPDLLARYQVSQGTVPFFGATIGAEARELCGSRIGGQIINVPSAGLGGCLPSRLESLGYHSIALHGMDGHMYHRLNWYRKIGFQEQQFRTQFRRQGLPDCLGAFSGTCDAAVAEWIGNRLGKKDAGPNFVYWVTLNSHLPVPVPSPLRNAASCSLTPLLLQQPALCSWYQLVANVHDSVSRLALVDLARPTVFVIVGDHAPPFADPELRAQFSSTEVPFVILVPRLDKQPALQTAKLQGQTFSRGPS